MGSAFSLICELEGWLPPRRLRVWVRFGVRWPIRLQVLAPSEPENASEMPASHPPCRAHHIHTLCSSSAAFVAAGEEALQRAAGADAAAARGATV